MLKGYPQPRSTAIFPLAIAGIGGLAIYSLKLSSFHSVIGFSLCLFLAAAFSKNRSVHVSFTSITKKVMVALSIAFLVTLLFSPSVRAAAITEYTLPPGSTLPQGLAFERDIGSSQYNVWFAEFGSNDKIGRLKQPGFTELLEFQLKTGSRPWDLAYELGSTYRRVWFTESSRDRIGVILNMQDVRPVNNFNLSEYVLSPNANPRGIDVNSTKRDDPFVWFTEFGRSAIGLLVLNKSVGPVVTEWSLPDSNARPLDILFLNNSGVWFTEYNGDRIGFFSFPGNITKEWRLIPGSLPYKLSNDTFGNIWFTESGRNRIAKLNPYTNEITEFMIPTPNSQPYGIWVDVHNNVWFTEHGANKIGRFTPGSNVFVEFTRVAGAAPWDIREAIDGKIWFSDDAGSRIGRLDPGVATTSLTLSTLSTVSPSLSTATTIGSSTMTSVSTIVGAGSTTQGFVSILYSTNASLATTTSTTSYSASETSVIRRTSSLAVFTSYVTQSQATTLTATSYVATATATTSVTATSTTTSYSTTTATTTSTSTAYIGTTTSTQTTTTTTTVTSTSFTFSFGIDVGMAKFSVPPGAFMLLSGLVVVGSIGKTGRWVGSALKGVMKKGRWKSLAVTLFFLAILFSMILPSRAAAFTEWSLPGGSTSPYGLVFDDQSPNNLWFAEFGSDRIGRLNPGTSEIREIMLQPNSRPWGIAFDHTRKELWFTESGRNIIGRITSYGAGSISEFRLTDMWGGSYAEGPRGVTIQEFVNGTNKPYIWFTEFGADRISRLDPEDVHNATRWALRPGSGPQSIVFSRDIGLWFTEFGSGRLGNLNPLTTTVREFKVASDSSPWDLAIDAQNNIWYTDPGRNKISRLNPYNGEVIEYLIPSAGSQPYGITIDSQGWIWFAEHSGNKIGRFVPDDNTFTEYSRTAGSAVYDVTLLPGTNVLWFTDDSANRIGRFDSTVAITTVTASTISTASTSTASISPTAVSVAARSQTTTSYSDASTTITFATTTSTTTYQVTQTATVLQSTSTGTSTVFSSDTITVLGTSTSYLSSTVGTVTSTVPITSTLTQINGATTSATSTSTALATTTTTTTAIVTSGFVGPGIPGFPIESIIVGIGLAATFLIVMSRRRRGRGYSSGR